MNKKIQHYLDSLVDRYPVLNECAEAIVQAYNILVDCFSSGHKLLIAGNGGSCADAEHIAGELMKGFAASRKCSDSFSQALINVDGERGSKIAEKLQGGLPTIVLSNHQGMNTAFINDVLEGGEYLFAQQTYVFGKEGDVFLAISTSGNSKNILNATVVAKALGLKIIALTGQNGGQLSKKADVVIKAPSKETYLIQELHLPIYHCLCLMLEERFFINYD